MTPQWIPSPNFNTRKNDAEISYIIIHYTDTRDTQEAIDILRDPAREVSAHYVIEQDGTLIQMVKDEHRTWHAGLSYWRGERDMNSVSLGIELVNPGALYGYESFPDAQIKTLIGLCRDKMAAYDISPENILAHSDIAPARKIDPDYLFPWDVMAAAGIGIMLADNLNDEELITYGYDPDVTPAQRRAAYERHFLMRAPLAPPGEQ